MQPTQVFLPGEAQGQRSLTGYSPWDLKQLGTTECACTHTHTHTLAFYVQNYKVHIFNWYSNISTNYL